MAILAKEQKIGNFEVQNLIKENLYTETYCVKDEGDVFFLKLFVLERLPERLMDSETGIVTEIENCKKIHNENFSSCIDSGSYEVDDTASPLCGTKCQYYVTKYLMGNILSQCIGGNRKMAEDEALEIFESLLHGLRYLHSIGLIHNDITPQNIMLDYFNITTKEGRLIDLGHLSGRCSGKVPFDTSDLDIEYCANETFAGMYDEQSDIFSVCAVLYAMLTGDAPWKSDAPKEAKRTRAAMLLKDKRKQNPLDLDSLDVKYRTRSVLAKGLALDHYERYKSVDQILATLRGEETDPPKSSGNDGGGQQSHSDRTQQQQASDEGGFTVKRGGGNGFADIAGMAGLKKYLSERVIFVIKNREMAEKYRLMPPNGMLFYGPPGCGKSFMAEKFAEETGFNFIMVKASDIGSTYVHGSQEKIANLFAKAEKEAPVVICFDEFDALVPDRSVPANQYQAGEVNEFLTQLNNCSKRGIFVIGTTNRPDKIDPAALRTGRIDRQVYIPLPDAEARSEMFALHLNGRPFDRSKIDLDRLAQMTEGYIASDIAYVVNDAALVAAFSQQDISEEILEQAVQSVRPSLRQDLMAFYEHIHDLMENNERRNIASHKIGFIINN